MPGRIVCLIMHSFHYHRGKLTCESYPLDKAAEHYGTPLYVYSSHTIIDHYQRLDQALHDLSHQICYAVKANSNLSVLRLLAERGAGFDIVSQIVETKPFVQAIEKMLPLVRHLKSECGIEFFSIGGGIGIVYEGSLESGDEVWWKDTSKHGLSIGQYAGAAVPLLKDLGIR